MHYLFSLHGELSIDYAELLQSLSLPLLLFVSHHVFLGYVLVFDYLVEQLRPLAGVIKWVHSVAYGVLPRSRFPLLSRQSPVRLHANRGQLFVVQARREVQVVLEVDRLLDRPPMLGRDRFGVIPRVHLVHYSNIKGLVKTWLKTGPAKGSTHGGEGTASIRGKGTSHVGGRD